MSSTFNPVQAVDNTALINAIVAQVNSNVDSNASATQLLVQSENDATQATLSNFATGTDLNANTTSVNNHTSAKTAEVIAAVNASGGKVATVLNSFGAYGAVNDIYALTNLGDGLTTVLNRSGSGVILDFTLGHAYAFEIWVDGVKAFSKAANDNAANIKMLGNNAIIRSIEYTQSIQIKVDKQFNYSNGVTVSHLMYS